MLQVSCTERELLTDGTTCFLKDVEEQKSMAPNSIYAPRRCRKRLTEMRECHISLISNKTELSR